MSNRPVSCADAVEYKAGDTPRFSVGLPSTSRTNAHENIFRNRALKALIRPLSVGWPGRDESPPNEYEVAWWMTIQYIVADSRKFAYRRRAIPMAKRNIVDRVSDAYNVDDVEHVESGIS